MQIQGLKEQQELLAKAIDAKVAVLLIGPTGSGKTTMVHHLARERKTELVSIPLHGQIGREELIGKWLLKDGKTYWQDGILTEAIRADKWVLFDEINAALPEVLFLLHALLDHQKKIVLSEKDNEVLVAKDGFRFFATMNPTEDYVGTKTLNMAFMSRFGMVLNFEYPDYLMEAEIIQSQLDKKISEEDAVRLTLLGGSVRELYYKKKIFYPCSTRDLISAARLMIAGANIMDAINSAVVSKLSTDEQAIVKKETEIVVKFVSEKKKGGLSIIEAVRDADKIRLEHSKFLEARAKLEAAKNGYEKALTQIEI